MRAYICVTCGTQFRPGEEPPADCPICRDAHQYVGGMVEWADRFDARIVLHEADRNWVMRPSERIEFWSGDRSRSRRSSSYTASAATSPAAPSASGRTVPPRRASDGGHHPGRQ
jgi:hypothetical protein